MQFFSFLFLAVAIVALMSSSHVHAQECSACSGSKKDQLVERLLDAKAAANVTFDQIAAALGVTNAYAAQLFMNQAHLKPASATKLAAIVPGISKQDLLVMQKIPMRSFDPILMQDPLVYRLVEAMQHYGAGLKYLINEKFGDGIMSAIDIYADLQEVTGVTGERRIAITLNGKYLPHIEQETVKNTAVVSQK